MSGMNPAANGAYRASAPKGVSPMEMSVVGMPAGAAAAASAMAPTGTTGAAMSGTAPVDTPQHGPVSTDAVAPAECATCASRTYQDSSTDAGVSFKAPGKIDPSFSAATVMGHEQEHVSIAQARAEEKGGRIIAAVTLKTAICPECGRVYVAGGEARITTITPVEKAGQAQTGEAAGAIPGSGEPASAVPAAGSSAEVSPLVLEDGGTDLFRNMYKKRMAAHYGLFVNVRL